MDPYQFTYRELTSQADYEQCVALQSATWGDDFRELVPPILMLAIRKVGGILLGAHEPGGALVGFVFGITGLRDGEPVHWSHMLAVREDLQGHGIGRRLKELQREHAAALGVRRIQWSYDPLVARNAYLNLNRLGVRVLEYVKDMYGTGTVSLMDSVIGTDRLIVEWDVAGRDKPADPAKLPSVAPVVSSGGIGAEPDLVVAPAVLVGVPPDIQSFKHETPKVAKAWRASTRRAFTHYFGSGYEVSGFARDRQKDHCFYLLQRPGEPGA